jgi:hypothetical protein
LDVNTDIEDRETVYSGLCELLTSGKYLAAECGYEWKRKSAASSEERKKKRKIVNTSCKKAEERTAEGGNRHLFESRY